MTDFKKVWIPRILIGALAGVLAYLLLSFLTQPGALFGKHCGFTALVSAAIYLLSLLNDLWLWLARVLGIANMAYGYVTLGLVYAAIALSFHILGIFVRALCGSTG